MAERSANVNGPQLSIAIMRKSAGESVVMQYVNVAMWRNGCEENIETDNAISVSIQQLKESLSLYQCNGQYNQWSASSA